MEFKDMINQVIQGDCLEIMKHIPDKSIDLVLTDPPYGMNKSFDNDTKDYLLTVEPALKMAFEKLVDNGSMFVFTSTANVLDIGNILRDSFKRLFWMYKPADCTYPFKGWLLTSEAILWFVKGSGFNLIERKPYQHDCYIHRRVGMEGVEGHPTVKPLKIISDFVLRVPKNSIVLDPFLGSGTTAVACVKLNRRFIGIEISPKYVEMAKKRIRQEQEKQRLFST